MADEYPSPEASAHLADPMDMSSQLAIQAATQAQAQAKAQAQARAEAQRIASSSSTPTAHSHYRQAEPSASGGPSMLRSSRSLPLTNNIDQIRLLRDFYARNPNPDKRELELLAERTGRPYSKVREYFRQRRNKLRGLSDLEGMEEPGRASGW